jgi:hypothetical protein
VAEEKAGFAAKVRFMKFSHLLDSGLNYPGPLRVLTIHCPVFSKKVFTVYNRNLFHPSF